LKQLIQKKVSANPIQSNACVRGYMENNGVIDMSCKDDVWWKREFSGDFGSLKALPEAENGGGRGY